MYSITQDDHSTKCISEKSNRFFQQYQIGKILKASNGNKMQGFSAIQILRVLFTMVFCHRSFFMQMNLHPASVPFGKDTVYRFLNSCHTNWRRFVLLLSGRIIRDDCYSCQYAKEFSELNSYEVGEQNCTYCPLQQDGCQYYRSLENLFPDKINMKLLKLRCDRIANIPVKDGVEYE